MKFIYPDNWNAEAGGYDKNEVIDRFKECMARLWAVDDQNDWPVRLNQISPLFASEFVSDLFKCLEELQIQGFTVEDIGQLWRYPTTVFRCFDLILKGMYKLGLSTGEKRKAVYDILSYVQVIKSGSIFNEDGRNIILSKEKADKIYEKFHSADSLKEQKKIQQIIGLLKAYIEQIYFRSYDISQEIHGPYIMQDESQLLVREFRHLAPGCLWPEYQFIPISEIRIYTFYDNRLRISLDSYNHMRWDNGNFIDSLQYAVIENADSIDLDILLEKLIECIHHNSKIVNQFSWREAAIKYVDLFYYKLKPLFLKAGYKPHFMEKAKENISNGDITVNSEDFFRNGKIQLLLNLLL